MVPTPPIAGTLWQTAQLVAVERRAEPFLGRLDFEEVLESRAEGFELAAEMPGKVAADPRRLRVDSSRS